MHKYLILSLFFVFVGCSNPVFDPLGNINTDSAVQSAASEVTTGVASEVTTGAESETLSSAYYDDMFRDYTFAELLANNAFNIFVGKWQHTVCDASGSYISVIFHENMTFELPIGMGSPHTGTYSINASRNEIRLHYTYGNSNLEWAEITSKQNLVFKEVGGSGRSESINIYHGER